MVINEQLQLLLAGFFILFSPMIISRLIRSLFKREVITFSESYKNFEDQEEFVSGRVLLEGATSKGP